MLDLMHNQRKIRLAVLALATLAFSSVLAACGSGGGIQFEQRAQVFLGGALSNFGGVDGGDPGARSVARDIAIAREYDLIQPGYTVGAGPITAATAAASQSFGPASGQLTVAGDLATAAFSVDSFDADVSEVTMTGTFSLSQAQAAVSDAGRSFIVSWEFEFDSSGMPVSISAEQTLSGTNWVTI